MLNFQPTKDSNVSTEITSAVAVRFFSDIDAAMEKAQGGKYRAFNLVAEMDALGFDISRRRGYEAAQEPLVGPVEMTVDRSVAVAAVLRGAGE